MKKGVNFILVLYILNFDLIPAEHHVTGKKMTLSQYIELININTEIEVNMEIANIAVKDWDPHYFANFKELETLSLENISELPFDNTDNVVLYSNSINKFRCNASKIVRIGKKNLSGMPNLKDLTFNENNMVTIAMEAFEGNPRLKTLSLAKNNFKELPEKLVENLTLTSFDFDNNRLYKFPEAKPFLISKSLQQFSCSACGITHIYAETFSELPDLHTLILKENSIQEIHENHLPSKLHSLNLESNPMNVLPLKILINPKFHMLCLGGSRVPWSENNEQFIARYQNMKNISSTCQDHPHIDYKTQPITTTVSTSTTEKTTVEHATVNPALLDALIASYLLVCLLTEVVLILVFGSYVAKLLRSKSKEFDYAASVINPSDIYKIN
ncbi:hypothetical protein DMENIID0001_143810 [Sergentomyia squamirostris]